MANSTLWVFVITKLPDLDPIHSASSIKGLSRVNTVTSRHLGMCYTQSTSKSTRSNYKQDFSWGWFYILLETEDIHNTRCIYLDITFP